MGHEKHEDATEGTGEVKHEDTKGTTKRKKRGEGAVAGGEDRKAVAGAFPREAWERE